MKDWIPLFQTLVWPVFISVWIVLFLSRLRAFFDAIIERIVAGSPMSLGLLKLGEGSRVDSLKIGEDLREVSDKIIKKGKAEVRKSLDKKQKEDYTYRDWINSAAIAYTENRYEAALHDFSQALQYAKTNEQTAQAMFNQGLVLRKLVRSEEALQVYKQIDEDYGKDTDPGVREKVARSL